MKSNEKRQNTRLIPIAIERSQESIVRSLAQRQRTEDPVIEKGAVPIDTRTDASDTPVLPRLLIHLEAVVAQRTLEARLHPVVKISRQKHPEQRKRKIVSLFDSD